MPLDVGLKNLLDAKLGNRILTAEESDKIIRYVRQVGGGEDPVNQVLEHLKALVDPATQQQIDLSTPTRRKNFASFLSRLDQIHALPLDKTLKLPDGAIDWVGALRAQQVAPTGDALPKKSFDGERISIDAAGTISLDGKALVADARPTAILALARPGQLELLTDAQKRGLVDGLLKSFEASLPIGVADPLRHQKVVNGAASLEVMRELAKVLTEAEVGRLLASFEKLPNNLSKQLLAEALDAATVTDAQKTALAALVRPEGGASLTTTFREVLAEEARSGGQRLSGAIVQPVLEALAFARDANATDAVLTAAAKYRESDPKSPGRFDEGEISAFGGLITGYLKGYEQVEFGFGYLVGDADKALAKLDNGRLVPNLEKAIDKQPPSFAGLPVTPAQAAQLKTLFPTLRNDAAVAELGRAMAATADMFGIGRGKALPLAAFALFWRGAERAFAEREATVDGMIDAKIASAAVQAEVRAVAPDLQAALRSLSGTPPSIAGVATNAEGAGFVRGLLESHLRSELSTPNIATAIKVIGAKYGVLEGEGLVAFKRLIDGYKAEWPNSQVFDFNKLGRMATFLVEGRQAPLCTVNGSRVPLSDFYQATARGVSASLDAQSLSYPWMADRWGIRAKESVELLDVIAQLTAEQKGPLVELAKAHPGRKITIEVTGAAGAHEQFIYAVEGVGKFNQASDGTISAYTGDGQPRLFTATIGPDGAFDVQVPAPGTARAGTWPRQTNYGVGDIIDVKFFDAAAATNATEGQPFESQQKILKGEIVGYDASGQYRVAYQQPDGAKTEMLLSIAEIRLANDPHDYAQPGSIFYDVKIDIAAQPGLKAFLEGARPIIDKHLPKGKVLEMSPAQLSKAQRECVAELIEYSEARVHYPADNGPNADEGSKKYHAMIDGLAWNENVPLEALIGLGKGVCRHQCIIHQLLLQEAGIDSRIAIGAANQSDGRFRGFHAWNELSLADNARYLSDLTWSDTAIPLWSGAYDVDKRRKELLDMTASLDVNLVT